MATARTSTRPRTRSRARTARDDSTREHILETALEAFSIHGFEGASTRAIAAGAGVNQGLIPYYFGTKERLWREAVDRAFESLHEAIGTFVQDAADDLSREDIAQVIRRYVAFVASHPEFARLMNEEGKRTGPRMRWLVDHHVRPLFEGLAEIFERAAAAPGLPAGIDPAHLSYIFIGAVAQIFHQAPECRRVAGYDPMTPEAVRAHGDVLVHLLLGDATLGRGENDRDLRSSTSA